MAAVVGPRWLWRCALIAATASPSSTASSSWPVSARYIRRGYMEYIFQHTLSRCAAVAASGLFLLLNWCFLLPSLLGHHTLCCWPQFQVLLLVFWVYFASLGTLCSQAVNCFPGLFASLGTLCFQLSDWIKINTISVLLPCLFTPFLCCSPFDFDTGAVLSFPAVSPLSSAFVAGSLSSPRLLGSVPFMGRLPGCSLLTIDRSFSVGDCKGMMFGPVRVLVVALEVELLLRLANAWRWDS